MPFKIVSLIEKNKEVLCIVPEQWVSRKGKLQYPKNKLYNRLSKDEQTKPRPDWCVAFCSVKRSSYASYQEAEVELNDMLENSDTDMGEYQRKQSRVVDNEVDFNNLAEHLILTRPDAANQDQSVGGTEQQDLNAGVSEQQDLNAGVSEQQDLNAGVSEQQDLNAGVFENNVTTQEQEVLYHIVQGTDEVNETPMQLLMEPSNVEQMLNKIYENQQNMFQIQNIILENQRKNAMRLASLSVQLEQTMSKLCRDDTEVVELHKAKNSPANDVIYITQIKNIEMLEAFDTLLASDVGRSKTIKQYSILCSASVGRGKTCAYKLLDLLFTREFISTCSWSGGSRGAAVKIPMKKYINVVSFFFKLINQCWDSTYSVADNEHFFKGVLRNSARRIDIKDMRAPAKKSRVMKEKNINVRNGNEAESNNLAKEGTSKEHHREAIQEQDSHKDENNENITENDEEELC